VAASGQLGSDLAQRHALAVQPFAIIVKLERGPFCIKGASHDAADEEKAELRSTAQLEQMAHLPEATTGKRTA
jgi:hypothetical protein